MARAAKDPSTGVTVSEEEFARQWVLTGRPAVAYRRAYPNSNMSAASMYKEAARLLDNPRLSPRVEFWRKIADEKLTMGVAQIIRGVERVAAFDIRDCFDANGALLRPHEMPEAIALALDGIDVVESAGGRKRDKDGAASHVPMFTKKVRNAGRMKALEVLARIKKMITERGDETGDPNDVRNLTDEQLEDEIRANQAAIELIERASSRKSGKARKLPAKQQSKA